MSEPTDTQAEALQDRLQAFMDEHVYPNEGRYHDERNALADRFSTVPLMEELKAKAREAGLWNLWLPADHGGLTADYPMAEAYNYARWCRQADGPDQVHMMALGKQLVRRYAP